MAKRSGPSNAGAAGVNKEQAPNEKLEAFRNLLKRQSEAALCPKRLR